MIWFKQQRAERLASMRPPKPKRKVKRKSGTAKLHTWLWRDRTVEGHTKSEARSAFKRMFELSRLPAGAMVIRLSVLLLCFQFTGCQSAAEALKALPPGTQLQSSTTGLKFSPQAVDGVPLTFGSHTSIITTANPADAGPNINRFEASAPWIHLKSTVATGPVGDELQKAGGPEALRFMLGGDSQTPARKPEE